MGWTRFFFSYFSQALDGIFMVIAWVMLTLPTESF